MATREKFRKRHIREITVKEFCRKCVAITDHADRGMKFVVCRRCNTPRDRRGKP